jgi:DNA processing protein
MTRDWIPASGWTGNWKLPRLLTRPVTETERGILVALAVAGFGPNRLVDALNRVEAIDELSGEDRTHTRAQIAELKRLGARAVVPSDDEYPDELAEIAAPPPLLFVRGQRLDAMRPFVAIVGARACTAGAARFAERLGEAFATAGFGVVSGMARGIDAAAHRGALDAGKTVAVFGTGIDVSYPIEHGELAERIAARGALISEFAPGIGPRRWHFPSRNRIISGLSCALIVVEAGLNSGALITAGFALDQGRDVFACTTGPENPAGAGVRAMLADGAELVVDPDQAVESVCATLGSQEFAFGRPRRAEGEPGESLTGDQRRVFAAVLERSTTDEVARNSALDASRVAAVLSELELDGYVALVDGRWSRRSRERRPATEDAR